MYLAEDPRIILTCITTPYSFDFNSLYIPNDYVIIAMYIVLSLESELLELELQLLTSIFSEVCILQASNFVALNIKII